MLTERTSIQALHVLYDLSRLRDYQSPGDADVSHLCEPWLHLSFQGINNTGWELFSTRGQKGSSAKDSTHKWREDTEGNIADRQEMMDLTSALSLETWVLLAISLMLLHV